MMHRQPRDGQQVRYPDVEQGEPLSPDGIRDLSDVGAQLSNAGFHRDFPQRHHADQNIVGGVSEPRRHNSNARGWPGGLPRA